MVSWPFPANHTEHSLDHEEDHNRLEEALNEHHDLVTVGRLSDASLNATIGALGQYELQPLTADFSHSWVDVNTNATANARFYERVGLRLRMTPITGKGASGRTIGDVSNLALSGTMASVPRTKALHLCICSLNDDTLFQGSAASYFGHKLAWESALSLLTSNAVVAANTTHVVYSAGWVSETIPAGSKTDAQGAIQNSTGGVRWKTTTVGSYGKHKHQGSQGVDLVFVARAAGAGLITVTEGSTALGTLDLTNPTAQDCTAIFKVRGLSSGTHEITFTLTSGASMTLDSVRIPMPSAGLPPIVVLGESPVIPAVGDQPTYLADLEAYKTNLAAVVEDYPSAVYLDLNQEGWDTSTMLSANGKHPNDAGCAWIATKIIDVLAGTPFRTGLNVLGGSYPSAYVPAIDPAVPSGGQDGTSASGVPAVIKTGYTSRYKASDLTDGAGTVITAWVDETATANFTGANGPTLRDSGFKYLEFDAANDALARASFPAEPVTLFFVARCRVAADGVSKILAAGSGSVTNHIVGLSSTGDFIANSGVALGTVDGDTSWHVLSVTFNGTSSVIQIDGQTAESGTTGTGTPGTTLYLGRDRSGGNFYPWDVAEVILYSSALATDDRRGTALALLADYSL